MTRYLDQEITLQINGDINKVDCTIEIPDYLKALNEPDLSIIKHCYTICSAAIDWFYAHYSVSGNKPKLLANPWSGIKAQVSLDKIVFSRGIIEHARGFLNPDYLQDFNISQEKLTELCLAWIVFHECTHHARGHLKLFKKLGHPHAYEFDADCFAVAALYRYVVTHLNAELTERKIAKLITLCVVYWCIANIPDYDAVMPKESHPIWPVRLRYCFTKLVMVDIPDFKAGKDPIAQPEIDFLYSMLAKWDKSYHRRNNIPIENSKIEQWVTEFQNKTDPTNYIFPLWEEIEGEVKKNSKIFEDIFNYRVMINRAKVNFLTYSGLLTPH